MRGVARHSPTELEDLDQATGAPELGGGGARAASAAIRGAIAAAVTLCAPASRVGRLSDDANGAAAGWLGAEAAAGAAAGGVGPSLRPKALMAHPRFEPMPDVQPFAPAVNAQTLRCKTSRAE